MKPFHYHEPATIAEACRILKEHGKNARILAGGTDLVIQMKRGKISPAHVVNIKKISELNTITTNGEGIAIGAAVPLSAIVKHKDIAEKLPMVSKAAHSVGSVQVRNRATVGGNICNAAPSADMAPGLLALDTELTVAGPAGERKLSISSFFTGPGTIALEEGEILTRLFIPAPQKSSRMIYLKHGPREAMDCSVTGVALSLCIDPETRVCTNVRLALGAVAPTPVRAELTEKFISGKSADDLDLEAIAQLVPTEASPISDVRASAGYRSEMVSILTIKALETLIPA